MNPMLISRYFNVFCIFLMTLLFVFSENENGKVIVYAFGAIAFGLFQYVIENWLKDK